jgi:hypothetical protein
MMRKMAPWLVALVVGPAAATAAASAEHNSADGDRWVSPQGLNEGHNGGTLERLVPPAAGAKPNIMMILFECAKLLLAAAAGWFVPHSLTCLHATQRLRVG